MALVAADVDIPQSALFQAHRSGTWIESPGKQCLEPSQHKLTPSLEPDASGFIELTLSSIVARVPSNQMQTAGGGQRKHRILELLQIAAMADFRWDMNRHGRLLIGLTSGQAR